MLSRPTIEAMTGHLQLEAQLGGYEAAAAADEAIAATYRGLATLVGGAADEVAVFDNSTHAWNAAFYSIPFQAGDRIFPEHNQFDTEDRGVHPLVRFSPHRCQR